MAVKVKGKLAQLLMEFKAPMENYQPAVPKEPRRQKEEPEDNSNGVAPLLDPPASDLNIGEVIA
jgi:hypothetical protein